MSLPVLFFLSLVTATYAGCDFEKKGVENIKATIDSNPTGFRSVFPKDYRVEHRYNKSMLCETDPCCVFSAAVFLLDSWDVLLANLWEEHVNHSLIVELKRALDRIVQTNHNIEEEILLQFPTLLSSPEDLLQLTSEVFGRWLQIPCSNLQNIQTCLLPTLPPTVERKDYGPVRSKLLTTRGVSWTEHHQLKIIATKPEPSRGTSPFLSSSFPFFWSFVLFKLYW